MKELINDQDIHYVFFADDSGIASIFPCLKHHLAETKHRYVTLFYCSNDNHEVFKSELGILQNYFLTQLNLNYYSKKYDVPSTFQLEEINAILNVDTAQFLNFIISGDDEFVQQIKKSLTFLGIQKVHIDDPYYHKN
jgi:ferredoxin-NADP reductase